jgi:hypothetical protein
MTIICQVAAVVMALFLAGCSRDTLTVYSDVMIKPESVEQLPGFPKLGRWHVLERGSGTVLHVMSYDEGDWFTMDDETCSTLLVELPHATFRTLPAQIENPVSYLTTCSCTWRICTEESATNGTAVIQRQTAAGVDAELSFYFPNKPVRIAGRFWNDVPSEDLLPDSGRR